MMDSLKNILSLAYDALVLVLKKYWKRKLFNIHFGRLKSQEFHRIEETSRDLCLSLQNFLIYLLALKQ